ncbi:MAG: chemotaxis protein [Rhodoferax ferrireducens]|uniref:Chemotaxis protein methyltransferase n=1 Tax=Rhodoferax ferrireducens TaxID=192843 RepID=A0A1W9KQM3_9BURK|nr:MAG: chemotaxis protein [Rhodoferax ferrireducens]
MAAITITDDDFQKFREYFYRKTGINFEPTKRYFVDKRLVERIEATGNSDFRSYFVMLRFQASGDEVQQLTNLMTVNETYFLREEYQFQCLVNSILPELVKRKTDSGPIRIWCIPSSSGEEPYTIALYLMERWPGIAKWDVEIISSDIDTGILHKARVGRYSTRSVQHVPAAWLSKYFVRHGDEYQMCEDLRQAVEFTRVNLAEPADTRPYRNFDVIFCRNLLIYFDDVSRKSAAETFYDALKPGGFICLGHSESMSRISSLYKVRKFPEAIVYQKSLEAR